LTPRIKQVGWDVILIARPPIRGAKIDEVLVVVEELLKQAGLLVNNDQVQRHV
jgi:hypothetical protein